MSFEPVFLFSNPHSQHSFFTYIALKDIGKTILLCPPLQIQLLFGKWPSYDVEFSRNPFVLCGQLLCILSFLLYKARFLPERLYIKCLTHVTNYILSEFPSLIWFHYQDYIQISKRNRSLLKLDVCELIINSELSSENWDSTVKAISYADYVTYTSSNLANMVNSFSSKSFLVHYGGNKSSYQFHSSFNNQKSSKFHLLNSINIAARANTIRKGIDIFLESLLLLNSRFDSESKPVINIIICGAVSEPRARALLDKTNNQLSNNGIIKISSRQYTQSAYLNILRTSDLFVMPSRLEGSSPAALEALWLGVPSVLSQACGIDQFKDGEHGIILSKVTPQLLCDALYSVIHCPIKLRTWRSSIENDISLYTWKSYLDSYKCIFAKHLERI